MKESQYVDEYLRTNTEKGVGDGVTISSFLNRKLRGKAKKYSTHYHRSLKAACDRRVVEGTAVFGPSVMFGIAYYSK